MKFDVFLESRRPRGHGSKDHNGPIETLRFQKNGETSSLHCHEYANMKKIAQMGIY